MMTVVVDDGVPGEVEGDGDIIDDYDAFDPEKESAA